MADSVFSRMGEQCMALARHLEARDGEKNNDAYIQALEELVREQRDFIDSLMRQMKEERAEKLGLLKVINCKAS